MSMAGASQLQSRKSPDGGRLFIVSAPSGAGKTTLCDRVRRRFPDLAYSISYTTRRPRPGETDGVDYFFISEAEFLAGVSDGRWAEWARVHDNYYATSAEFLDQALDAGRDVLLDIDVQGAMQVLERYPDSVSIFIMPPSMETLRRRMEDRGQDSPDIIDRRMKNAETEVSFKDRYDHVIVNDNLEDAENAMASLVDSRRAAHDP